MNKSVVWEFKRLRKIGWTAHRALWAARTRAEWESRGGHLCEARLLDPCLECKDGATLRLIIKPDEVCSIDDLMDTTGMSKQQEERFLAHVEREGVVGLVAQSRCGECGTWRTSGSIWGIIGNDWKDDVEFDLMDAAIRPVGAAKCNSA